MDLRRQTGKHLLDDRRRPPERHAFVSPEDSRQPGAAARRVRALDERPVAKRRRADTQRLDERASLGTTHRTENTTANNGATAMIETTRTIPRLIATLAVALCVSSCGGIQNAINPA